MQIGPDRSLCFPRCSVIAGITAFSCEGLEMCEGLCSSALPPLILLYPERHVP